MAQEIMLLIDGNSLIYRAFHALPFLSTSTGLPTNAVYGFTNMLLKLLAREQPDHVAVAFDMDKETFRHKKYKQYKANRPPTPDELQQQFPIVKEILQAMRIRILECQGYEADDIIGALTAKTEQAGLRTIVVTGDRDILQLVSPFVSVRLTKRGISTMNEYNEKKIWDKYGIKPQQLIDLKGMAGDPSDNVPGIFGIGEKTAAKLLKKYGSLEEILAHTNELAGHTRQLFDATGQQATFFKWLVTICREVPMEINLEQCLWPGPNHQDLLALFKKLEFHRLIKSMYFSQPTGQDTQEPQVRPQKPPTTPAKVVSELPQSDLETHKVTYRNLNQQTGLDTLAFLKDVTRHGQVALAPVGNPEEGLRAIGFSLYPQNDCYYLDLTDAPIQAQEVLKTICADAGIKKSFHNGKEGLKILSRQGYQLKNLAFDTMVAAYLLNPTAPNRDLSTISLEHLNIIPPAGTDEATLPAQADCIGRLAEVLANKLNERQQGKLFYQVELPLVRILSDMELHGVNVDREQLLAMSQALGELLAQLSEEIYELAGYDFNINSSKQLGKVLFDDLKLPAKKKTKTGYSTDAGVLEELAEAHALVAKVLEYRQLAKLKSTYTDGLAALINPATGRLHTSFHQTVTATGRLSSSEPNLQNIPIRLEQGRLIRKAFIPCQKGNILLAADYSQIELRVLAHISEDPVLIDAFQNGEDIHTRTAVEVFGVSPQEIDSATRRRAKAVNFGIVYGLSDYGLARDIKVGRQEAKQYIENYLARYAGVKAYMSRVVKEARATGYVTTLLNRRRYLPDLLNHNRIIRKASERTAINTPIQGSAADIIKLAMISVDKAIAEQGLTAKMLLQVHDELIFELPREEIEPLKQLVKNCMESAVTLKVPLDIVLKTGPNWYEVKE